MTAKKNPVAPATSQRITKTRANKAAKTEATESVPGETALPADLLPTEAAEAPTHPALEPLPTVTPMPVPVEAAMADQVEEPPQGEVASLPTAPTTRLSALDAALRVLGESGQAMNCQELVAAMAAKDYWSSPQGRTPAGTLYACFFREMKTKGEKARIIKTTRGTFALRQAV